MRSPVTTVAYGCLLSDCGAALARAGVKGANHSHPKGRATPYGVARQRQAAGERKFTRRVNKFSVNLAAAPVHTDPRHLSRWSARTFLP